MGYTEFSPIWDNKHLQEVENVEKSKECERCGLRRLAKLYKDTILKSFQELREEYGVSRQSFYKYLQIRHALKKQFKERPLERSEIAILRKVVDACLSKGLISKMYGNICEVAIDGKRELPCKHRWAEDLGGVMEEQWRHWRLDH